MTVDELAPIRVPIAEAPRAWEMLQAAGPAADRADRLRPGRLTVSADAGRVRARRPIEADDMFRLRWLSEPRLSPEWRAGRGHGHALDRERDRDRQPGGLGGRERSGDGELQSETRGRLAATTTRTGRRTAGGSRSSRTDPAGHRSGWSTRSMRSARRSPTPRPARRAVLVARRRVVAFVAADAVPATHGPLHGGAVPLEGRRRRRRRADQPCATSGSFRPGAAGRGN